eukprot:CAMPEP_0174871498 /NCGR_PEP_ID=MMETSP1114-20130205/71636_1 /TAXON_ID=312471 /ORGANISM="Neobodo designis, Strain CCAP 1951/1" /LENGTH=195 /DNA_ID=CAMNT_0016106781 /DNA_START=63 /DNA_END=646 /DNA_ORIENTATION=+
MAELLAKQGYNVDDPTSVPGIFTHAAPVLSFVPPAAATAGNGPTATASSASKRAPGSPPGGPASPTSGQPVSRVFIDESNDDLVVIAGAAVTFARPALLDDSALSSKAVAMTRQAQPSLHAAMSPRRSLFTGAASMRDFNMASSVTAADLAPQGSFDRSMFASMLRSGSFKADASAGDAAAADEDPFGATLTDAG